MKNESFFKSLHLTSFRCSNNHGRHLRIADILASDEDEQYNDYDFNMNGAGDRRRDDFTNFHCSSPRRIIALWLKALKRLKGRREAQNRELDHRGSTRTKRSIIIQDNDSSQSSLPESKKLERSGIDASFNMGVAFGLLNLIVESKNELTKMVELRKEMEMLLQNVKEESQGKSCSPKFESNDTSANSCLTTDVQEVSNFNSTYLPDSENTVVCDEYESSSSSSSKCVTREQAICSVGMNELELELEAELQRLQLHLDMDNSLHCPQKQRMKKSVVESASTISENLSFGEVIDPQESDSTMQNGVSPIELERRLHELLEAKQQERIEELAAALECAKHKLCEKEREVSWWQDTACITSKYIGEPQRLRSLLNNPKGEHQRG